MIPSTTPNTATWSHSRPLTRWIVDTVTPLRVALGVERLAQPRLERGRVGVQVGDGEQTRRGRRDGWHPARRRCGRAGSSPSRARRTSRTTSRMSSRRPVPAGVDDEAEVVGEVEDLGLVLVGNLRRQRGDRPDGPRPAPGDALGEPLRQTPGRPAQDLDDVAGGEAVWVAGDAQVGERGPQSGAAEDVGRERRS